MQAFSFLTVISLVNACLIFFVLTCLLVVVVVIIVIPIVGEIWFNCHSHHHQHRDSRNNFYAMFSICLYVSFLVHNYPHVDYYDCNVDEIYAEEKGRKRIVLKAYLKIYGFLCREFKLSELFLSKLYFLWYSNCTLGFGFIRYAL